MVEWGALEKRCGRKVTVGSNPTLSAKKGHPAMGVLFIFSRHRLRDNRADNIDSAGFNGKS